MAIKGVLRNIIYVEDMHKMVLFYRDVLQLPLNYPHTEDYSCEYWVEFQAGSITIARQWQSWAETLCAENCL